MKKVILFSSLFICVLVFVLSCSKGDTKNITSEKNNTIVSENKPNTINPLLEDDERKWGEIICGDSTHVGTECTIIGRTCKYHTCDAGTQIQRALSEKEIIEYAKKYADEQVKKGFIQKENEELTFAIMKSGLKDNNKKFK